MGERARRRRRRRMVLAVATAAAGAIPPDLARASFFYDLRLPGGGHAASAISGLDYSLELWARVSGTNATQPDDGLTNSYIEILSTQLSGGAALAGSALQNGSVFAPFNSF